MHKVSVVMACYNGEKKMECILDSLRRQTRLPDEVLMPDDCSTDQTVCVIREYINKYHIDNWSVAENEQNLGWKRNFMQGLIRAKGDLLFLCDQDDSWEPEKIRKMEEAMEQNPGIDLLACDYDIQYGDGSIPLKKYRKRKQERTGETARYQFTSRFFQNASPGCTYAVRKSFLNRVKDYWFEDAPHDEFLWLMAAMEDGAWFMNRKLMTMYRGTENASDIRYKDISIQKKNLEYISVMLEKMDQAAAAFADRVPEDHKKHIQKAKEWCRKRQRLMDTRNPFHWLTLMPYWRYYNSRKNCLSDLYLVLFGSFSRK